jgi:multicomponent Na+:H+ antiporter subunit F
MLYFLFTAAALILATIALGFARILRGPGDADRVMAGQLLGTGAVTVRLLACARAAEDRADVDVDTHGQRTAEGVMSTSDRHDREFETNPPHAPRCSLIEAAAARVGYSISAGSQLLSRIIHAPRESYARVSIEVRAWRSAGTETKSSMPFLVLVQRSHRSQVSLQTSSLRAAPRHRPIASLRRGRASIAASRE